MERRHLLSFCSVSSMVGGTIQILLFDLYSAPVPFPFSDKGMMTSELVAEFQLLMFSFWRDVIW